MFSGVYILMALGLLGSSPPAAIGDSVPQEGKLLLYPGDKIVMYGDSITTNDNPTNFYWWEPYKYSVDAYLTQRGKTPPTWINSGIGGAFTDTLQQPGTITPYVLDHEPTVVIIHVGVNCLRSIPEATAITHYTTILNTILGEFPSCRIMMLTPAFNTQDSPTAAQWNSYAAAQRNLGRSYGIPVVCLRSYHNFATSGTEYAAIQTDGVHPTVYGRSWWSRHAMFQTNIRESAP